MTHYDHIIIGSGQATGTLLGKLTQEDVKIAVIEGAKVGGSCVNYGCTPTKALVASARAIHMAKRGNEFGFDSGDVKVDFKKVRERMNEIRNASNEGLTDWLEESDKITLYRGWGSFVDENTVEVNGEKITGDKIYINTGTRSVAPDIDGLEEVPWLDNQRLLNLEQLPEHLLIIGGGYIGIEFAQIYRRFGAQVTVIQHGPQIMSQEDEDFSDAIKEFLEDEGIEILCDTSATAVSKANGKVQLTVENNGKEKVISGSHLLIAAGRKPNTEKLNLAAAGIELTDKGYIKADDFCRTNVAHIYAVGDVNGKGAFTHTSVNDAEVVLDHLSGGDRKVSDRIKIYSLFTDPPLGRVGMSEKEALKKGKRVLRATKPMSEISRAKEMSETTGFAKLLVDAETDMILGASILGPGGDEIINMFAAIMHSKIPCRTYREVVLVHPTVSELMPFMLDGLEEVEAED
ncbi:mercuric reductase [Fulvivirga sp. RKSG066]|uniref:mercuric reductase n=1 Tax=Fulvivirga aurantia TaxID=2529383 RepID=UPI0012BC3F76|nr:mercuric reductase [Fulvivirga aurantia]MTI19841.1 mercuric reductase [Fulvivirga aurantia]